MSRTPNYDPDAILRNWFAEQLRLHPDLTDEKLMQAAATHFHRPHWLRQRQTYRVWQLALEAKLNQPNHSENKEDTHADPD